MQEEKTVRFQSASCWRRSGKLWWKTHCHTLTRFNPHRVGEGLESRNHRYKLRRSSMFQSASCWRRSGKSRSQLSQLPRKPVSIRIVLEKVWKDGLQSHSICIGYCFNPHRVGEGLERNKQVVSKLGNLSFNPHRVGEGLESEDEIIVEFQDSVFQSASCWRRSGKITACNLSLPQSCFNPHRVGEGLERDNYSSDNGNVCRFQSASCWRRSGKL